MRRVNWFPVKKGKQKRKYWILAGIALGFGVALTFFEDPLARFLVIYAVLAVVFFIGEVISRRSQ
ncbi:MAG: hypothetical protein JSV00_10030 [bacterium]|nr:MAG: hypothetical protein JSV00_10030 [bacterium]